MNFHAHGRAAIRTRHSAFRNLHSAIRNGQSPIRNRQSAIYNRLFRNPKSSLAGSLFLRYTEFQHTAESWRLP